MTEPQMMLLIFGTGFLAGAFAILPLWLTEARRNGSTKY